MSYDHENAHRKLLGHCGQDNLTRFAEAAALLLEWYFACCALRPDGLPKSAGQTLRVSLNFFFWPPCERTSGRLQFTVIEDMPVKALVWHPGYITSPAELCHTKHCQNTTHACLSAQGSLYVWNSISLGSWNGNGWTSLRTFCARSRSSLGW